MLLHAPDVLIADIDADGDDYEEEEEADDDDDYDDDDDDDDDYYDHGTAKAFAAVGFYYKAQMRG